MKDDNGTVAKVNIIKSLQLLPLALFVN